MARICVIITGGTSAAETDGLRRRAEVFAHVEDLCRRMQPHAHRFMLAASCNTATSARWQMLVDFRDAWEEFGGL